MCAPLESLAHRVHDPSLASSLPRGKRPLFGMTGRLLPWRGHAESDADVAGSRGVGEVRQDCISSAKVRNAFELTRE